MKLMLKSLLVLMTVGLFSCQQQHSKVIMAEDVRSDDLGTNIAGLSARASKSTVP